MNYLINFSIFRRNKNLAFLYAGQFVSFLGTMITGVALPYQIYHETHSTLMVGLLSLFQLLPLLFTALIGGVFADKYHRKKLLIISEAILAVGSFLLAYNAAQVQPHLLMLFIVSSAMAAFNGLHRPALESMTQQIVAKEDFSTVGALQSFKASVCMIAGPAIGGLIIAHYGIVLTYLTDFVSFAFSLCCILAITHIPKPVRAITDSTTKALMQGLRYATSRQELMGTYLVDFIAMIFGMPTALFPAIAQSFGGVKVLGLLYSAPAIGALFISLFSGWARRVKRHGAAIAIAAMLWGVAIVGFGCTSNFDIAIGFLILAGAFDAVSGIFRSTMWNETIPHELRGRMSGIEMISYLSGPRLGDTEAGLVAAAFGISASIISGGILCVVGVGICCYYLPIFWRYKAE